MPQPEPATKSEIVTNPTAPAPGPVHVPAPGSMSPAEAKGLMEGLVGDTKAMQAWALQRAADSENRLKKIEAEVMSRGMQLARVEKNLVRMAEKLGLKYE
jgi:hypothetical protein